MSSDLSLTENTTVTSVGGGDRLLFSALVLAALSLLDLELGGTEVCSVRCSMRWQVRIALAVKSGFCVHSWAMLCKWSSVEPSDCHSCLSASSEGLSLLLYWSCSLAIFDKKAFSPCCCWYNVRGIRRVQPSEPR